MQRVRDATLDRLIGRRQRLGEHLAAEYLRRADIMALATKYMALDLFQVQQAQQLGQCFFQAWFRAFGLRQDHLVRECP